MCWLKGFIFDGYFGVLLGFGLLCFNCLRCYKGGCDCDLLFLLGV